MLLIQKRYKTMKIKYILLLALLWGSCTVVWADMNSDLQNAAEEGDVATIQALIKQGADIETHDKKGNTPLKNAVRTKQLQAVKILVCEMNYADAEILVRFVDGFGGHKPNYLRNIQTDLVGLIGLKRSK